MAEKTIVAKITIGVPCPKRSVPLKDSDKKVIPGEFETVVLFHIPPGEKVTIDATEADALIERGVAKLASSDEEGGGEPAPASGEGLPATKRVPAAA